jgi:quinoprotein glucose dehydrogenase
MNLPPTGKDQAHPTVFTTKTLLIYGEGRGGDPWLHAVDKKTGKENARVALPATTNTAPMTYMHKGKQYVVLSVADPDVPAEHVALALPE